MRKALWFLVLAVSASQAAAQPTPPMCSVGTTVEPDLGKCHDALTPHACYYGPQGTPHTCIAEGERCGTDVFVRVNNAQVCSGEKRVCERWPAKVDTEGDACIGIAKLPAKGGTKEDVHEDNPPCGNNTKNESRCHWLCVQAPQGHTIANQPWVAIGEACNSDYKQYVGEDYATVEARVDSANQVCARFKNWSHDRQRCGIIYFRFEP